MAKNPNDVKMATESAYSAGINGNRWANGMAHPSTDAKWMAGCAGKDSKWAQGTISHAGEWATNTGRAWGTNVGPQSRGNFSSGVQSAGASGAWSRGVSLSGGKLGLGASGKEAKYEQNARAAASRQLANTKIGLSK